MILDLVKLVRLIGRIAFLASLTPFSLWRVGHNVVHHGFNNLRGRDFVWEPHDPESYAKLSPARQRMERIYRSAIGPGIYYGVEIWWTRLYFPAKRYLVAERFEFTADSLLVTAFAALWLGTLALVGLHQGLSLWAVFAIIWFGISDATTIFVVFMTTMPLILTSVWAGTKICGEQTMHRAVMMLSMWTGICADNKLTSSR